MNSKLLCIVLGCGATTCALAAGETEVEKGDLISVIGPSGAGKSTLLHILGMHGRRSSLRCHAVCFLDPGTSRITRRSHHRITNRIILT